MTTQDPTAKTRGFTIVELMMSLAVLAVGISGIIAMQKVTAVSNMHSKSVAIATQIANAWQDQLLTDGTLWRSSIAPPNTIRWLRSGGAGAWFRPTEHAGSRFSAAFDALGSPVTAANIQQAQFCVHLQLVPMLLNAAGPGNDMIRATIRVLWPRAQGVQTGATNFCDASVNVEQIGKDTANYHTLYQTVAIRVHP